MFHRPSKTWIFFLFFVLLSTVSIVQSIFAEIVTVSPAGSYSTTFPTVNDNGGGRPPAPDIWKTPNLTGPTPTSDWSSSVLWTQYSERMYADPISVWAKSQGLEIHYAKKNVSRNTQLDEPIIERMHPETGADLYVQNTGFVPTDARADKVSDWAIDISMASGTKSMIATVGHGSPYVYFTLNNASSSDKPRIVFGGTPSVFFNGGNYVGITVNGNAYGIFLPSGSTWTNGPDAKTLDFTLAAGKSYFSVALLPDSSTSTLAHFRKFAYTFVTNTAATFQYNAQTNVVTSTFTPTLSVKETVDGVSNAKTLMSLYPHQWRFNTSIASTLTPYTYATIRGTMKVVEAASFETSQKYLGILPWMPTPLAASGYNASTLTSLLDAENAKTDTQLIGPPLSGTKIDAYATGKIFNRLAQLAAIARQVGHPAADRFLNLMSSYLEDWLTVDASEQTTDDTNRQMLYYDTTWKSFIGMPTGYYADAHLNDHHFHYGYWVYAAAHKALTDPVWRDKWKNMINTVLNDYGCTSKSDTMSPYLRNYDPYAGHSWADGKGQTAHGNNQESSSEALNAYAAMILWGEATGNAAIKNFGIWMYTTEIAAVQNYWFDIYGDVHDPEYDRTEAAVQYGGMYAHLIFWEGGPEQIHGINFLPLTGHSLYLGYDTNYLRTNLDAIAGEVQHYKNRGVYTSEMSNNPWKDVNGSAMALVDPNVALTSWWDPSISPEYGESKPHTYHWMYSLKSYGQVDTTVRAVNHALYSVFHQGTVRNYVAYNPTDFAIAVTFTDGYVLSVPAKAMATGSSSIQPLAPPTGVTLTPDDKIAFVTWNAVDGATGYNVAYTTGSTTQTLTIDGNTTKATLEGLTNGTTYSVRVSSVNYAGAGTGSTASNVTPVARLTAPSAVTLSSAAAGNGQVTLKWNRSAGATWYLVKYGTLSGSYPNVVNVGYTTDAQYTISALTNGRLLFITVSAANSAGESANSNEKTSTPGVLSSFEKGVTELGSGQAQFWINADSVQSIEMFSTAYSGGRSLTNVGGNKWALTVSGLTANQSLTFWFNLISSAGVGNTAELANRYTYVFSDTSLPPVSSVTFNPAGGTYSSAQTVTLSTATLGASIRYTLDSSDPTSSSPLYTSALTVSSTTTVKAFAFKSGMTNSSITSATYTIVAPPVLAPDFTPVPGTYTSAQSVTLSSQTSGATIRYTLDGSTPTSSSPIYSSPIAVGSTTTIKAYATKSGMTDSTVSTGVYTINLPVVAAPSFNPAPGTYATAQTVTLSSSTPGATIRYTLDGSTPTSSSAIYSSPLNVSTSGTIKAYASKSGMTDSTVTSGDYVIGIPVVAPVSFSPAPGTYTSTQSVTLSTSTPGATIRYTLDGSTPTATSPVYSSAISVAATTTVKAYASKSGMTDSSVTTGDYVIQPSAEYTQSLTITGGNSLAFTFVSNVGSAWVDLHFFTSKNGAQQNLRLTKSVNTHTYTGTTAPTLVSGDTVTYFFTYEKSTLAYDTPTFVKPYNSTPKVSNVTFSPAPGTYSSAQSVVLATTTPSATIRYTTNGTTPTSSSPIYTAPIAVGSSTTIQAFASASGYLDSDVVSGAYVIQTNPVVEPVTTNPAPGSYTSAQLVSLSSATPGATIRYTLDGSTPNASSTLYSSPIAVSATTTIKAYATKSGYIDSSVTTATYTIVSGDFSQTLEVTSGTTLNFTFVSNVNSSWVDVHFTTSKNGAQQNYRMVKSGNTHTTTATTTPTLVSGDTVSYYFTYEKATMAYDSAMLVYTVSPGNQVATPTFSLSPGVYSAPQSVAISTTTAGATIRYTLDGSTPTASSALYTAPITVSVTTTIKAYATKSGMSDSNVATGAFTIGTATPLVIDSFNSATNWANRVNSLNKTITTNGGIYNLEGNANLYFFYNGGTTTQSFTEGISQSLSGYSSLILVIRGDTGGEQNDITITLNDASAHSVALAPYGSVTSSYTSIAVPLSAFGANLANVQSLTIGAKGNAKTIRIDEIRVQ